MAQTLWHIPHCDGHSWLPIKSSKSGHRIDVWQHIRRAVDTLGCAHSARGPMEPTGSLRDHSVSGSGFCLALQRELEGFNGRCSGQTHCCHLNHHDGDCLDCDACVVALVIQEQDSTGFRIKTPAAAHISWLKFACKCPRHAFPENNLSTLAITSASILISGGQGRLKPSPGIFFVASMPSLLPMAISLVA